MKGDRFPIGMESRMAPLVLLFCSIPYLGMRLYLWREMHAAEPFAAAPGPWVLATMAVLGGLIPAIGLGIALRTLIRDRDRFRLRMLLEVYVSLILIFASGYAIIQASSVEPSFSTIPRLWRDVEEASLAVHVRRLHEVFLDSLYLSVITITTVGFGDIAPLSPWAKILTAVEGLVGIGFVGIALGHYFSVCLHRR